MREPTFSITARLRRASRVGVVFGFVGACNPSSLQTNGAPSGGAPGTAADSGAESNVDGAVSSSDASSSSSPASTPLTGVARIWAVHDGEKIDRDDRANGNATANEAWDGKTIRIFAARNEIVAFQVVVESTGEGIHALSAALPSLRLRGDSSGASAIVYAPPALDPTAYAGRPIAIFVENYMNVTQPTEAKWIFDPGSAAAPANPKGWKPVQLVPENATAGRGGFPLEVAGGTNQALWFEVYTGRGLPAGTYDGAVKVMVSGVTRDIPIELRLYDFDLPDEGTMSMMAYFEAEQLDLYMGTGMEDRFHRFAHRQRIELVNEYDAEAIQASIGRFDGSDFTAAKGYAGPGEGAGNRIVPATIYGPGNAYDDRASAWQTADAWMTMLAAKVPRATTFLYMPDEPSAAEFPRIQTIAANVKSSPGAGALLPIFATTGYAQALDGSIDIWCPGPSRFDVARSASERARGRQMWFYNGRRPASGAIIIDAPATDPRMIGWAAFKYEVPTYFYWHADQWQHNAQKVNGDRNQDVWVDPITFDNRGQPNKSDQGAINGDGVLIYPGKELLHPEQDRGIEGPVSSVQLANLRRGLQDHMYLTIAKKRGLGAQVDAALAAIVPHVFSDAGPAVSFPERGDPYEKARRGLAEAITK